jgi:hypothetical protein
MAAKHIDVPLLFRLWADHAVSREEIASRLGVAVSTLGKIQARHKLPMRPVDKRRRRPQPDPTLDEIEERARECRERHYENRRCESEDATRKRIWNEETKCHLSSSQSQA